jgi:mannose-6-phosphate isomerase-like protein (cupin superfamily)
MRLAHRTGTLVAGCLLLIACTTTPPAQLENPPTMSFGRPAIIPRGGGDQLMLNGRRPLWIMVDSTATGSRTLVAGMEDMLPGDSIPTHKHLSEDEIVFVHRGAIEVELGEDHGRAEAGATVFIPRGTWIGIRVAGNDTATIFFVFNAPAFERCLRSQSSRPGEAYVMPTAERSAEIRHDCHQVRKRA